MVIKHYSLLYLIAIFNFVVIEIGMCQSPITFVKQISVDDLLNEREVRKIDRDNEGFFWLLEQTGIQKYDGRFVSEKIAHPVTNPKYFKCLPKNKILLVSEEAKVFLVDVSDKITREVSTEIDSCSGCRIIDVNLIGEDLFTFYQNKEEILVAKVGLEGQNQNFEIVHKFNFSKASNVENIFKVADQYLLLLSGDRLFKVHNHSELELLLPNGIRGTKEVICSNFLSETDLIFSMGQRKGTFRFKEGKFSVLDEELKLVFARQDRKGKILLALSETYNYSEQVFILEKDNLKRWSDITGINETYLDAYVEDLDEQVLLGSHSGLFFLKLRKNGILPSHQSNTLTSNFGNVIMSMTELPNGEVYYVKENKGIFKYNGENGPNYLPLSDKLVNNLNCRYDERDGQLWVSGYSNQRTGLLYSYNLESEAVDKHVFQKPVLYFKRLDKERLILSTSLTLNSTILLYNTESKTILDTLVYLENERTRRFEYHGDSELLIATSKRAIAYDLNTKQSRTIIPETFVQSIVPIEQGYAVCTIGKGIIFLDTNLEVIAEVNEGQGLTNNSIYSVIQDDDGKFWIGTANGLNVVDSSFQFVRSFDMNDGLSSYELNTNANLKMGNGNLLFGTINGVTEVDPGKALTSSESAVLSVPAVNYLKDGEVISQLIQNPEINIPRGAENINLKIVLNDFHKFKKVDKTIGIRIKTVPENLAYSIKENEVTIPALNTVRTELSILPPNLVKDQDEIKLILIEKRSYRGLFLAIAGLLVIILISYFIASKVIKSNKSRENERRENEVRMAELELQALRSQMNPHFIFNSLGAILLYLQTNEKKKAEKYLTKFAKLMRMFLESSKTKFISFTSEQNLLELYLELEKLRFEDKFDYDFEIDPRIDTYSFTIPSMLLQPFVENSINHGLYHKKENDGKLLIKAVSSGENVKIIIEDNGVGRERAREIRENSIKKHRSRATEIIQERILVLKKEKNIDIDIQYEDLKDELGQASGTRVFITIPKILRTND